MRVRGEHELVRHDWSGVRRKCQVAPLVGLLAFGAATMGAGAPAGAQTAEPSGAFGYSIQDTILFGGNQKPFGPAPTVTLPDGGSATPVTANAASAEVRYGPGILFTSGAIDVSTQGTTGTGGSVTSKAHITGVPAEKAAGEILYAGDIKSECTASGTGTTASTTLAGPGDAGHAAATLRTSDGDPNKDGDEVYADLPANPPANYSVSGTLESVGDTYKVVFNEQTSNGDGSISVYAAHEYLLGPTLTGNLYLGHAVCSVGAVGTSTTTNTTVAGGGGTTGTPGGTTTGGSSTTGGTSGMPTTGTNVTPLVFIALELVGAGALAVRWATRRRVWPLR